jgi:predicted ArsR family transcriptional regulator
VTAPLDFFTPQSRHGDPETSKDAASSMRKGAAVQRDQIVNALHAHGPMNHWQIDNRLGFQHPTAARRMRELIRSGRVVDTGRTSPTGTGRGATVYDVVG